MPSTPLNPSAAPRAAKAGRHGRETASNPSDHDATRIAARADAVAHRMDNAFRVPLTRITLGWDSVLGLVPGIGDTLALVPGLYILRLAKQAGVSRRLRVRMGLNLALDWAIGLVPLAGDLFDIAFKANLRNAALLRADVEARQRMRGTQPGK